jgi:hypothetical protein
MNAYGHGSTAKSSSCSNHVAFQCRTIRTLELALLTTCIAVFGRRRLTACHQPAIGSSRHTPCDSPCFTCRANSSTVTRAFAPLSKQTKMKPQHSSTCATGTRSSLPACIWSGVIASFVGDRDQLTLFVLGPTVVGALEHNAPARPPTAALTTHKSTPV